MKTVYFVRHGESEGNIGPVYELPVDALTEKGRKHASLLAERTSRLPIDICISSTLVRAKHTAELISTKLARNVEYSELFNERIRPKEQRGLRKDDPRAIEAEEAIKHNFHNPSFKYSDEESFDDLIGRSEQALEYLLDRPEKHILVVTHGFFMRILLAHVVLKDQLSSLLCEEFIKTFSVIDTSLSILVNDNGSWRVAVWNDQAHLE